MRDVSVQSDEVMLQFGWYAAQSAGQEHEVVHHMADEIVRLREALAAATRVTDEMVAAAHRALFSGPTVIGTETVRAMLTAALEGPRD